VYGQLLTQILQLIHFSLSKLGALNPLWVIAPFGHALTRGHGWFEGHLSLIN
jgi:hypothetical protein